MKKLLKTILTTTALAMVLGAGVAVGAHQKAKVEKVEAAASAHQLIVKFGSQGNWNQANAKLAVYLWKGSGASEINTWTNTVSLNSEVNIYKLDYTFDGTPEKMIISRQNSSAGSTGSWGTSWAQSSNLDFNEGTYLNISEWNITSTSGWKISADVRSNQIPSFGTKTTLSTIGLNDSNNPEVSGSVTLAKDEEFKILSGDNVWSGYYGCPAAIDGCFSGGSKTGRSDSDPNITCLEAGTYDFFFDTETKRLWLSRQDIVDADGYASYFLSHVGCDESGVNLPSGWSDCASTYASLSAGGKDYLYSATGSIEEGADNIARCVYWYDYAVRVHPSLTKFMKNSSNVVRASSGTINTFGQTISKDTTAILATVIIVVASLTAVGGFFLLKKKKEIK